MLGQSDFDFIRKITNGLAVEEPCTGSCQFSTSLDEHSVVRIRCDRCGHTVWMALDAYQDAFGDEVVIDRFHLSEYDV